MPCSGMFGVEVISKDGIPTKWRASFLLVLPLTFVGPGKEYKWKPSYHMSDYLRVIIPVNKYTFMIIWKARIEFEILRAFGVHCWNHVGPHLCSCSRYPSSHFKALLSCQWLPSGPGMRKLSPWSTLGGLQKDLGKSCVRVRNAGSWCPVQGLEAGSVSCPFGPEGGVQLDEGPDPSQGSPFPGRLVYVWFHKPYI